MAEQEEKSQQDLLSQLEQNDVKVADDAAAAMKENILKENSGQQWLGLGVHEVFVKSVELTEAKSGTLGMKLVVENADGKSEVTFWLSPAALPYTIENVSRLVVHNTAEDKKADARNHMSNITSAKEVLEVAQAKLVDGVAFLSVREARDGSTYVNGKGETVQSLERNLLSYKPKETATQTAAAIMGGGEAAAVPADGKKKLDLPF